MDWLEPLKLKAEPGPRWPDAVKGNKTAQAKPAR
jgi:hypothetical protein